MASLFDEKNGTHRIDFTDEIGKRRSIRLKGMTKKHAQSTLAFVERLTSAKRAGFAIDGETASWLGRIPSDLRDRLHRAGLCEAPLERQTIGELVKTYLALRTDLKPGTAYNLKLSGEMLCEFFKTEKGLDTFNEADAEVYAIHLDSLCPAKASKARHLKRARQFFGFAVKSDLLTKNPFASIKPGPMHNDERLVYVPVVDVLKVIEVCPSAEWAGLFAFARFAGLRIPSEIQELKWADVDFQKGTILIHSPKLEHHPAGGKRTIPLFAQLRPHLERLKTTAAPDAVYLFPLQRVGTNPATHAKRLIAKAEVPMWKKPFQNLRSSCENDLTREHPEHVVVKWIGHTEAVARKHYLHPTDEDLQKAIRGEIVVADVENSAAKSAAVVQRNPQLSATLLDSQKLAETTQTLASEILREQDRTCDKIIEHALDYPARIETTLHKDLQDSDLGKISKMLAANSAAPLLNIDPDLLAIAQAWDKMPENMKAVIRSMAALTNATTPKAEAKADDGDKLPWEEKKG